MRCGLRVSVLACVLVIGGGGGRAQEPERLGAPAPLMGDAAVMEAPGDVIARATAADRALRMGLPTVAAELYRLLAEEPGLPPGERDEARLQRTVALLEDGRVEEARAALAAVQGPRGPRHALRSGLVEAAARNLAAARAAAAGLEASALPVAERSWLFYLQGLIADEARDFNQAKQAYAAAVEAAGSELQRARFVLADLQAQLNLGQVTEAQAAALRQNVERYQGRGVGYDYAKQYAAVLSALGRKADAVAFLQRQLQTLPVEQVAVRDDFRLLIGLIAGPEDGEGRAALLGLLASGTDGDKQRVALRLLARTAQDAVARRNFRDELTRLIEATQPHRIMEDLLLFRAQLAMQEDTYDAAEADARALLERFPGSELRPAALGVLVGAAWERGRYRTAAGHAAQARAALPAGQARAELGVLLAEAFFRAGDFPSAAEAYAAAQREVPAGVAPGGLMFQEVASRIQAGRLDEAARQLDVLAADSRFDVVNRWRAEWNLGRALQAAGQTGEAYARVNRLLAPGETAAAVPPGLAVRLAWLQARLAMEGGEPERALTLLAPLRERLGGVEEPLRSQVASSLALLEAETQFARERREEAFEVLRRLREEYPRSDAAVYSFIVEADAYEVNNQLVEAQRLLTRLADDFPDNRYAPYALFEAALNAENRAQEAYYQEAYNILERIVQRYPRSELLFYARLKQGDLLRQLNQFGAAQQVYELLINNFGQHQDVLAAQLALADCHAAQAATDASHQESANTIYERLRDLPVAPDALRVEAGFKLGYGLLRRGEGSRARGQAVWWQTVSSFLLDEKRPVQLGARGRYWMARTLIELGGSLEQERQLEQAREAYELLVRAGLPGAALARARLERIGGGAMAGDR